MSLYQHVFFDLDHTLWDYDANASEALFELYDKYRFEELGTFSKEELVNTFFEVNYELWDLYNYHRISRADIRKRRFPRIFQRLSTGLEHLPAALEMEYIALAPTKSRVFPHSHEVLDYLKSKYQLHVITNGFDDIQATKIASSQFQDYFGHIITSESSKSRKPNPKIFEVAFELTGADEFNSIMIGDNLNSDIAGAKRMGMDYVWFNPQKIETNVDVQREISNLLELKTIL